MTEAAPAAAVWRHERLHQYYKEHQVLVADILLRCNWEKLGYRAPRSLLGDANEIVLDEAEREQHLFAIQQENAGELAGLPLMTQEEWLALQLQQQALVAAKEEARQARNRARNKKKRNKQRDRQKVEVRPGQPPSKKHHTENRRARELDIIAQDTIEIDYAQPEDQALGQSKVQTPDSIVAGDQTRQGFHQVEAGRQIISYSED